MAGATFTPLAAAAMDAVLQTSFAANLDPEYGSINLGPGSPMASLLFAVRQLSLIIQGESATVSDFSRLTSSEGADIDSYVAPFGFQRLGGTFATQSLLFGTNSPVSTALPIPPGAIVQRVSDGTQYALIADSNQPNYSSTTGLYTIPVGSNLIPGSFVCLTEGSVGNMSINTPMQVYGGPGNPAPAGLSIVSVTQAITNGVDSETDAELIARFQIQGGFPKYATLSAILSAIASVQPGLVYQIGDHINLDNSYHEAYFTVVANAGNSPTAPTPGLLQAIDSAVDAVRAGGVEFQVVAPTLIPVTLNAQYTTEPGVAPADAAASLGAAWQALANGVGLNIDGTPTTLSYARTISILLGVTGIANISNVTLNGGTSDIVAQFGQQIVASAGVFS